MNATERTARILAECYDDFDLFNSAVLGRPAYWWRQREVCDSLAKYKQTIVYSGNATGKDYLLGGVVPAWLHTRHRSLVIATGPSQTVLGTVTWKEIRLACDDAVIPLGARITSGAKSSPQVCAVDPRRGWQALGYSTTNVERASGQHNRKLLVVVEEASGVEDEVWEALDGLKYVKLLAIGNPIRPDGEFVRRIRQAEKDKRDRVPPHRAINAIRIPSTDSPDIHLEESGRGLADLGWLEQQRRRYGESSLWWRSHVEAEIPTVAAENLLLETWLDWACSQVRPGLPLNHPIHLTRRLACDLGEGVGSDSTCIVVRDDLGVLEIVCSNRIGLEQAAVLMRDLGRKWNIPPQRMSYDKLGIGRNMHGHLFNVGLHAALGYVGMGTPLDQVAFLDLRSEAAWKLRNRLDPAHNPDRPTFQIPPGPHWPRLRTELLALTTQLAGRGKTQLLSKEAWVAKLGHSPDVADALIQSFAFAA